MRPFILFICVLFFAADASGISGPAKAEIGYLLEYVENSKGRFIRSGKEYSGEEAAAHLRRKLSRAGNRVKSTEDFIEGIASKSYLTGSPYRIKLPDGSIRSTGPWLKEALAERRRDISR